MAGILDLVFHPDIFFERVSRQPVNLLPPLAIIGAAFLLNVLGALLIIVHFVLLGMGPIGQSGMIVALAKTVLCDMLTLLLIWGVASVYFYLASRLLSGTGSFPATVQNTGYGLLPLVLASFGYAIDAVTSCFSLLLYHTTSSLPAANVFFWIHVAGSVAAVVWAGILWMFAIRHTHSLTVGKSALVSGIFTLAFLVLATAFIGYAAMVWMNLA